MKWSKFKDHFHESWHKKMRPFIESEECDKLYKFLKNESSRGKRILPSSHLTYRCFKETTYDDMKVVLCGLSPYHTLRNGEPVADGLLMGCSTTNHLQPSLENFYNALEQEFGGLNLKFKKHCDVSYLANQGVLMLNASLTTELYKAGSHLDVWEPFMKYLFEEVINPTGVPIIFLGKEAAKLEKYTMPFTWVFKVSHPASASYNNTEWDSKGVFKNVNKVLMDRNNFDINWLDDELPF